MKNEELRSMLLHFQGDIKREEYARWMLLEILLDPDYEEGHQ